ncbi:MAG: CBS domain-containing protein [Candidatus Adiutricales bacterium]
MKLEEIMAKRIVTIDMDDTLDVIRKIFDKVRFHHMVVIDEKYKVVGVISDRDVLKALSPYLDTISEQERDQVTLNKKTHQVMSRQPITASPEDSIEQAAALLLENRISCLPVISEDQSLVGIVTWKDILKNLTIRS